MTGDRGTDLPDLSPGGCLFMAMALLAIGAELFLNLNEDPAIFILFALVFALPGAFLLIAGAVAFGMQISRQADT